MAQFLGRQEAGQIALPHGPLGLKSTVGWGWQFPTPSHHTYHRPETRRHEQLPHPPPEFGIGSLATQRLRLALAQRSQLGRMIQPSPVIRLGAGQDSAARPGHPGHLAHTSRGVRKPQQEVVAHNDVEDGVGKGQRVCIALHVGHIAPLPAGEGQHVNVQIQPNHTGGAEMGQFPCHNPGAAPNLQDNARLPQVRLLVEPRPSLLRPAGLDGEPGVPFLGRQGRTAPAF